MPITTAESTAWSCSTSSRQCKVFREDKECKVALVSTVDPCNNKEDSDNKEVITVIMNIMNTDTAIINREDGDTHTNLMS